MDSAFFYTRKQNKKEDVRLRGTSGGWEHGDLRMFWVFWGRKESKEREKMKKGSREGELPDGREEMGEIRGRKEN